MIDGLAQAITVARHAQRAGDAPIEAMDRTLMLHRPGRGLRPFPGYDMSMLAAIYVAKFADAIYVLHAFKKKTQKTARSDLDLASARYMLIGA